MRKRLAIAVVCCAFTLVTGLVGCGGASSGSAAASGSAASGSASATGASASASAAGDSASEYTAAGYIDEFGIMTAKALVELDGTELTKVAEAAGYKWDDKHAEWTRIGSELAPSKGLTSEEMQASFDTEAFEFSEAEVAGLAAGGKGTPIKWLITSKAKVDGVEQAFANQQVKVVDQCNVEHKNYGKQIWAIVENSAGDRFLMCVMHYSDKSVIDLYTADYIATNSRGIASAFNLGDYLLEDAHTIDAIWPVLQSGEVS